jgi:hypothetical protein
MEEPAQDVAEQPFNDRFFMDATNSAHSRTSSGVGGPILNQGMGQTTLHHQGMRRDQRTTSQASQLTTGSDNQKAVLKALKQAYA